MEKLEQAYEISKKALKDCYGEFGILAGRKRFDDYWARDAFFASLGAISIEDYNIVRSTLNLFLNRQKENGQLPRKILNHFTPLKYLGIKKISVNLTPKYKNSIYTSSSTDQNSLFILSLLTYIKKTKDFEYLDRNYYKIKKAVDWNFTLYEDNLIKQGMFGDWEDTTIKGKFCLYPNILHYVAIISFIEICKLSDKDYSDYQKKAEMLKEEINKRFWKENYYTSWENTNYIDVPGNLLAIIFNLTTEEQANKILDHLKEEDVGKNSLSRYPIYRYSPWHFLRGTKEYHNGFYWIWISCLHAISLERIDRKKEALKLLENISDLIVKHNNVYEVYFKEEPVNKTFFKSEVPFAWSAGLFIMAYNSLNL